METVTEGLRSHVVLKHTDDHYVCPIDGCERRYGDHNDLKYHMRTHSSEPAFPCRRDGCPEVFRSEHYLKKHRVSVHKDRPKVKSQRPTMACEWPGCDYKANKQLLQVHRDLHTGAKPYVCEWPNCGKRFRLQSNLKDHKNVHNNLKPYECQWPGCQYKCNNSGNLIKHVKHMHH
ncbi:unnamed protein product [Oppiella nova]|uniref:C2H2-type domain-containing protein n=1 Tax=Oppiella nova TaxID=334625 RepID=A0A7R9MKX7_9ACAR|nr:unnamed protein product [Oppiella nova]CAG2179300.1 unnamed protein product [Oppiella nova]